MQLWFRIGSVLEKCCMHNETLKNEPFTQLLFIFTYYDLRRTSKRIWSAAKKDSQTDRIDTKED